MFSALVRTLEGETTSEESEAELNGVTLSSFEVRKGDLFVGLPGRHRHGAELAQEARRAGAVALLTDPVGARIGAASGLPTLVVDEPRSRLGEVSGWVYGTAESRPALFGVTGTNGKTSTVHMIEAILVQLGVTTGLSSTAERHVGGLRVVSNLTTPEAPEFHALLARMNEDGVTAAAIEVSAQSLVRHRVDGVAFEVTGFTNLSHDHLDDFGDMESYLMAKSSLFGMERSHRAVISLDSDAGERMRALARVPVATLTSQVGVDADWKVTVLAEEPTRVVFTVASPFGESITSSVPVIGRHMAANAGLAIAMLVESGWPLGRIAEVVDRDGGIDVRMPGRSELVSGAGSPALYVDFGHSPDAFARTLAAVRTVTPGRVIMVFGADGDRDPSKRPAMAREAVRGSDALIVTDHHPRFEDPAAIRKALLDAARESRPTAQIVEVADPKKAIRLAVRMARRDDAILWAGPGHQNYRDIEGRHVPYSARDEARSALREAGWSSSPKK